MEIDPTETKSVHVKSYVEPSVSKKIEEHEIKHAFPSYSAAVHDLIIKGICSEEEAQSAKTA